MPKKTKKTKKTTQKQKQKQSVNVKVHIDQSRRGKTSKQYTKQPQQYIPSINLPPPQSLPIIMNAPAQPAILQPTLPQAFQTPTQANTLGTQPPRYPDYYNDDVSQLGDPDIEYSQVPNTSPSVSSIPSDFTTSQESVKSNLSEQIQPPQASNQLDDLSLSSVSSVDTDSSPFGLFASPSGIRGVSFGGLLSSVRRQNPEYMERLDRELTQHETPDPNIEKVFWPRLFTRPRTIFDETLPDIRLGDDMSVGTVESTYNNPTRIQGLINQHKGQEKGRETQARTRQRQREQAEHMNNVRGQSEEIEGLDGTIFSFV